MLFSKLQVLVMDVHPVRILRSVRKEVWVSHVFQIVGPGESLGDLVDGTGSEKKQRIRERSFAVLLTVQSSVCKHANTHITNRSAHSEMLLPHSRSAWADIEYQLGWSSQYAKITFDQNSMPTSVQMTKTQSAQCTQPQIPINLKD